MYFITKRGDFITRISVIGVGYVGLVTGACLSELGFNVTCIDKDEYKISLLKSWKVPIFEPLIEEIVKKY